MSKILIRKNVAGDIFLQAIQEALDAWEIHAQRLAGSKRQHAGDSGVDQIKRIGHLRKMFGVGQRGHTEGWKRYVAGYDHSPIAEYEEEIDTLPSDSPSHIRDTMWPVEEDT